MNDLISRRAAIEALGEDPEVWDKWTNEYELGMAAQYRSDKLAIEAVPSIDAVPVVRCKDCKYYFASDEKCQMVDTRLHFYECDKRWTEESYCSWGERKEE